MKILVVDDDRMTRFLLRRVLITEFGCAVTEAVDGIDALEALARGRYHLVILDLQMPVMDGLETLRALRQAAEFRALPVVMLTAERNEAIVQQVVALGVLDYMTKPLVPERIVQRLRRVIGWLSSEQEVPPERPSTSSRPPFEEGAALLVVDGNEGFRRFFAEMLGARRTVLEAPTGARGFRACLDANPAAVFIGSGLGVLDEALLVRKIRSTPALRDMYLIAIADADDEPGEHFRGYDGRITRTFVPEVFLKQLEALSEVPPPGALRDLLEIYPGLRMTLVSTTEQVFGMLLATDVALREGSPHVPVERITASARGRCDKGTVVELRASCDLPTGRQIAGNLLGIEPSMVDDADVDPAVCEVFSMITGRLQNTLTGKQVRIEFDPVSVSRATGGAVGSQAPGLVLCFQSARREMEFWLMLHGVEARAGERPAGEGDPARSAPRPPSSVADAPCPPSEGQVDAGVEAMVAVEDR